MSEFYLEKRKCAKEMGLVEFSGKWYRQKGEELEEMIMWDPIFGWLSSVDISNLRQTDPRIAP